jgi:hypothetical protein
MNSTDNVAIFSAAGTGGITMNAGADKTINFSEGTIISNDVNASRIVKAGTVFNVNGTNGIDKNMTVLKDVDLVLLTKTYCDMNFLGGILVATTCT